MKKIIFLLCVLCAFVGNISAQSTYDVFTYTEPKGYKKEIKTGYTSYTKVDTKSGTYCIISLYTQTTSSGDIKQDFKTDWQDLVAKPLNVIDTPQKNNSDDINNWKTYTGAANFDFNGATSMALLTTAKNGNSKATILVVTNSQTLIKDADLFFAKLKLGKPTTIMAKTNTINTKPENADKKIELWMSLKLTGVSSGVYGDIPSDAADAEFYALFPNGDYYPHYHFEGMGNAIMTPGSNDSWGKYNSSGNKINFKSKYDAFVIEKKTATKYSKTGSVFTFYKCANVDGLKLQGGWTTDKGWRNNPYNKGACRPVIYFGSDGSFIDKGAFLRACGSPSTDAKDQPGEGTYNINNFTLTLKYNDGRVVSKAFAGIFDKNPAIDNKLLFMANIAFYKDLN